MTKLFFILNLQHFFGHYPLWQADLKWFINGIGPSLEQSTILISWSVKASIRYCSNMGSWEKLCRIVLDRWFFLDWGTYKLSHDKEPLWPFLFCINIHKLELELKIYTLSWIASIIQSLNVRMVSSNSRFGATTGGRWLGGVVSQEEIMWSSRNLKLTTPIYRSYQFTTDIVLPTNFTVIHPYEYKIHQIEKLKFHDLAASIVWGIMSSWKRSIFTRGVNIALISPGKVVLRHQAGKCNV